MESNQENCCNGTRMNCTAGSCSDRDEPLIPEKEKIILITVHLILIIATVLGNSLVFKAFHKFPSLRTASNVILVSLCVADSLIAIACLLDITLIALIGKASVLVLCLSGASFNLLLVSVIILHLALISVDRFIAIKFSLRYHTIMTKRRALIASIAVWLWAVVVTLIFPLSFRVSSSDGYKRLLQALHPWPATPEGTPDDPSTTVYLIFLATSLLVVPLVIILCSYGYIFIVSKRHRKTIKEQAGDIQGIATMKREMRGARTLAIVVAVCLLSIVPLLFVTILRFIGEFSEHHHPTHELIKYIAYDVALGLNAICNPLVYGWRNEQFRSAFRKLRLNN